MSTSPAWWLLALSVSMDHGAEYAAANWVGGAAAESTYAPTQVISLASLLQ